MNPDEMSHIQTLTKEEKLELVDYLWDLIASTPDDLPVSDEEKALLDQRLDAHRKSPEDSLSLDEFKTRLAERL
jgi:putative addiction module component (TIGR02574 family)